MYVLAKGAVKVYVTSRGGDIVELVRHHAPTVIGVVGLLDGTHSTTGGRSRSSTASGSRPWPSSEFPPVCQLDDSVAVALALVCRANAW